MIGDRHYLDAESDIAVANGTARPPAIGSGPIERSSMVRAVLPCETCSHRTVCAIRPLLEAAELEYRTPPAPHPAIRIALTAAITCEHYLEDPTVVAEVSPRVPFVPLVRPDEARRAARNGQAGRTASLEKRQARQARIDAELEGKPLPAPRPKTWTRPADYAEATNQALRDSGGSMRSAGRAIGLAADSAMPGRVKRLRELGLLAPDVEALLTERAAERLGGDK